MRDTRVSRDVYLIPMFFCEDINSQMESIINLSRDEFIKSVRIGYLYLHES